MNIMDTISYNGFDYLIYKVWKSEVGLVPYEYIYIENFLKPEHYNMLKEDWKQQTFEQVDDDHCLQSGVSDSPLINFLIGPAFYNILKQKLGATRDYSDIDKFVKNFLWDKPEHYIGFHTDAKEKETIQFHIYMPDVDYDKYGTILTKDKERTQIKEFPLKANALLVYGKNLTDYHYTEPGDRERKSLLVRFR